MIPLVFDDLVFRLANQTDYKPIAALHAKSWQQNYRGVFSDEFLDEEVIKERLTVWRDRFENPEDNQFVLIAEIDNTFVGFICGYIDHHPEYGALIDNLHVDSEYIGKRIGEQLMLRGARFLNDNNALSMYLWVLSSNKKAIRFYERLRGKAMDTINDFDIGDREITKTRYFWSDINLVLGLKNRKA